MFPFSSIFRIWIENVGQCASALSISLTNKCLKENFMKNWWASLFLKSFLRMEKKFNRTFPNGMRLLNLFSEKLLIFGFSVLTGFYSCCGWTQNNVKFNSNSKTINQSFVFTWLRCSCGLKREHNYKNLKLCSRLTCGFHCCYIKKCKSYIITQIFFFFDIYL